MTKTAMLVCLALWTGIAGAQTAPSASEAQPTRITKIVRVRYANPEKLAHLAGPGMPVDINADNALQAIVIKGTPAAVATVEQTIRELDVPANVQTSKDIELVVSILGGSSKPDFFRGGEVPEPVAPVVKQLRAVFPYKNYQLLSSMLLRSREGEAAKSDGIMQSFAGAPNGYPTTYTIQYGGASVSSVEGSPTVHLRRFGFISRIWVAAGTPSASETRSFDVSIETDVDLREGQKVVVGKANVENGDSALFVVLSARLVE
ncbi:MAG: hypothetical protein JOY54_02145 [Acidobacteriaceae bacterium]|nr:hypothetical protein [Acidobacteriaceae bacterium]